MAVASIFARRPEPMYPRNRYVHYQNKVDSAKKVQKTKYMKEAGGSELAVRLHGNSLTNYKFKA